MSKDIEQQLRAALAGIHDPYMGQNWLQANVLKALTVSAQRIEAKLEFGYPLPDVELLPGIDVLRARWQAIAGGAEVIISHSWRVRSHVVQPNVAAHPAIRNVIAVGSGKGGVGKSTTAVNLACALAACGARVGILDADIYGPNLPRMLGVSGHPEVVEEKKWMPVRAHGVQSISIGYLVGDDTPTVWRGPMVSGALLQLLNDTLWEDLDYLFVDLPPGTGDVQLTMAKKLPVTAAVMVSTPQAVALQDVHKGIAMLQKVQVPLAGLVENMSSFACPHCGNSSDIFATGGGKDLAQRLALPFLGQIPLQQKLREAADAGVPAVVADEAAAKIYREIALKVAAWVAQRPRGYSQHFAAVEVESE